jgi:hypothetical protein
LQDPRLSLVGNSPHPDFLYFGLTFAQQDR